MYGEGRARREGQVAIAESAFGVTYDGPALAQGRMPVRDLAPALLALGELVTDASVLLYPDRKPVALNIEATQQGSFIVDLILETERTWDRIVDVFGADSATALVTIKELIVGGGSLFGLIRWIRGRRLKSATELPSGQIRLTLEDGTSVEVPSATVELYRNIEVRRRARQVVEPLTRDGVEAVEFRSESETTLRIERDDFPSFELPAIESVPLGDREVEMVVAIASVAFTEGNKWRLTDGESTFYAAIDDTAFLERVDHGIESFRKGDMLECRMRIVQSQSDEGLHTEYHLVEVIRHIPRAIQLPLDAPREDEPGDEPESLPS